MLFSKANLNFCGSLIVAILSGSEFKKIQIFVATQNCLKISDGFGEIL